MDGEKDKEKPSSKSDYEVQDRELLTSLFMCDTDHRRLLQKFVLRWVIQSNLRGFKSSPMELKFGEYLNYATVLKFDGRIEISTVSFCFT